MRSATRCESTAGKSRLGSRRTRRGPTVTIAAILAVLVLLIAAPVGLAAQETVIANVGPLIMGIGADQSGNIYLADASSQQIDKFSPSGSTLGVWTNAGPGMSLGGAGGLAVSPFNGNVYVAVAGGVTEYTPSGAIVKTTGPEAPTTCTPGTSSFGSPIAVDPTGNVYLGNQGCIRKYTADLEPLLEFGGAERFTGLSGIAIPASGRIFATDLGNRVQEFDSSGNYLGQWGGTVGFAGIGTIGGGISATRSGNLLVTTDQVGRSPYPPFGLLRGRMAELRSPTGELLGTYTWNGFGGAGGIVEGPSGVLYTTGQRTLLAIDPTEAEAGLTIDPKTWVLTGQTVNLDARESRGVFNTPTFAWNFGTGNYSVSTGTAGTTSTSFSTPGIKTLGVRVGVSSGKTATATQQIEVRPSPPSGQVGVTVDDGDYATNSRNVTVEPVWFPGSTNIVLANDGGFRGSGPQTLAAVVPWELAPGGTEKLPKTVYVRFPGAGQDTATFTDDIVLDTTSPVVEGAEEVGSVPASAAASAAGVTHPVKIAAQAAISGVSAVQIGVTKKSPTTTVLREPSARGIPKLRKTFKFKGKKAPKFVRVQNAAGTWSKWMPIGAPAKNHHPKKHRRSKPAHPKR
jgi:hypothetical protein